MAAKVFAVGDVLPATTQLKIYISGVDGYGNNDYYISSSIDHNYLQGFWFRFEQEDPEFNLECRINGYYIFSHESDYDDTLPDYFIVDISSLNESDRTIRYCNLPVIYEVMWEDLAPAPSGYTISFNSNGGTTISDIEDATELPTTLPTPTKSGYTFVAWYYESNFQTRAKAGDTIESNVTLYAKWHNLGSLFTEIADAIRSKDGTSENIRDVDFGERIKQIQGAKEEETKTVTPDFSSGSVDVTPTSGKVLSQVTINKDANLLAENIKKDVTVHGITGTLESGGGTSFDRIGIICFELTLFKTSSAAQTLNYYIDSEMLSKTFFTDGEGNWYLPEDVSVYYRDTYKGKANTALTLFSGTGTFFGYKLTFKVGTTPVALLLYDYSADDDEVFGTGIHSRGSIYINWNTGVGSIVTRPENMEFIELPGNFFDDFPYYYSSSIDYWKKRNFLKLNIEGKADLHCGWTLEDPD